LIPTAVVLPELAMCERVVIIEEMPTALRLSFYINNDFSSNSNPNLVFIYPIINYNSLGYEEAKFNYLNNSQFSCF
jgi:hypothetical protein